MSIIPVMEGLSVADITAWATSVTSRGLRAAAPRGRELLRREFSFERVEMMDVMGWRCGLSVEEYINPGRMNIERRPSI
jgi:hypothetical protein